MGRRIWNFIPCRWSWWESAPLSVAMVVHGKKKKNRKPHTTSCFEFLFLFEGMVPCLLLSSCLQCSGEASRSIMCFRKWGWCLVLKSLLSLVTGYQGSFHQLSGCALKAWPVGKGEWGWAELIPGYSLRLGATMLAAGLWEGREVFLSSGKPGPTSFLKGTRETGPGEMKK